MSPPAWGWPAAAGLGTGFQCDVPTRVGMARVVFLDYVGGDGCPHPRGDGPWMTPLRTAQAMMSPPAWGWPAKPTSTIIRSTDVPTRVGMARSAFIVLIHCNRCPHPRGDGPTTSRMLKFNASMSPPAWGWPVEIKRPVAPSWDVPTRVGMARSSHFLANHQERCPHPRGDGPILDKSIIIEMKMSPPAWGWPDFFTWANCSSVDVPTRVGMARAVIQSRCAAH